MYIVLYIDYNKSPIAFHGGGLVQQWTSLTDDDDVKDVLQLPICVSDALLVPRDTIFYINLVFMLVSVGVPLFLVNLCSCG